MYGGQMKVKKVQLFHTRCDCGPSNTKRSGHKRSAFILNGRLYCAHCKRPMPNIGNELITTDAQETPIL